MSRLRMSAVATAFVASFSLAMPVTHAAELPLPVSQPSHATADNTIWEVDALNGAHHRRYRGYRRGYRNRVDAGDIIAGVAILGTIAAIANATSANATSRQRRERQYPYRDSRYRSRDGYNSSTGIEGAASLCMREVERNARVESVDSVSRSAQGWDVSGRLYNGQGFYCHIDSNGRVSGVDYGSQAPAYDNGGFSAAEDNQWDDARYVEARRRANGTFPSAPVREYPAYPDGPVEGGYAYPEDVGG